MGRLAQMGLALAAPAWVVTGLVGCSQQAADDTDAARAAAGGAPEAMAASPALEPLVSIMELMQQTITPATNQLWSAWQAPETPEEWRLMEEAAITLLAASSLTGAGGTGEMDSEWVLEPAWQGFNQLMIAAGQAALTASRAADPEALLAAGDLLLPPCEGCHQQFNPAVINPEQ